MPTLAGSNLLLLWAGLAVVGLIVLVARFKWHAFIALTLASFFIGLCSRMELSKIAQSFQEGVGAMLGGITVVVGLGMVLGKLLAESGGAHVIATTLIKVLGERRLPWTMMLIGFVVGIPVFFTVGVVLLVPLLFTILRETGRPLLSLGIPLLAGLSVVHGLVPPHPGPMAAIAVIKADPGKTILYALLVGLPTAALAGPILGDLLARRVPVRVGAISEPIVAQVVRPPGFGLSLLTVLLPVLLMLLASLADLLFDKGNSLRHGLDLLGSPTLAMLLATLFSFYTFGHGVDRQQLLKWSESSLAPAGNILLVVGAGGGFNRVLVTSGVGDAVAAAAGATHLSPLILGWLMAALIRIATGSATVAITTAAGLVTPIAAQVPGTNLELLVIATGAGSLILSHVNDGGFWFVKEYFGLTVLQTLQSWTVLETTISLIALLWVLLLSVLL